MHGDRSDPVWGVSRTREAGARGLRWRHRMVMLDERATTEVQQRSTATTTETSRLRRTSMDGQQELDREFSNLDSML